MEIYFIGLLFLLGITFGSFFNVIGLRLPRNIGFVNNRSRCNHCERTLTWRELIPIASFVIQRAKCLKCKTKISLLYPVIELMTGCLFIISYLQFGFTVEFLIALLLVSMLMILFVSDIKYMLIPNKILLFFLPFFIVLRMIETLDPWYDMVIGAVVGFGLLAIIIMASNGGMGAGDMKLFGVLGIVLGWKLTLLTFFLAVLLGVIIGGIFLGMKRIKKKQAIPFGPYIVSATIIAYFYGNAIIQQYLAFFKSF